MEAELHNTLEHANLSDRIHDFRFVGIAQETQEITQQGKYIAPSGQIIDISKEQEAAVRGTRLISPSEGLSLLQTEQKKEGSFPIISVTSETTQKAAQRLVQEQNQEDLVVLNFASARKAGGGFLNGAKAQEESIARCSGLYPTLLTQEAYYAENRKAHSRLYTDHVIYSPRVPWFRSEDYELLEKPFATSFITTPAPNAGHLKGSEKNLVEETIRQRAGIILAVAEHFQHRSLLLGAWGCGVFKNKPEMVANSFGSWLESPRFKGSFDEVTFAVFDTTPDKRIHNAFETRFTK